MIAWLKSCDKKSGLLCVVLIITRLGNCIDKEDNGLIVWKLTRAFQVIV